jgi:hypothetical protein
MNLMRTCRDVTRLVLQGEDRALSLSERLSIRLHMMICAACPQFRVQVKFMRKAMGRWAAYGEGRDSPD